MNQMENHNSANALLLDVEELEALDAPTFPGAGNILRLATGLLGAIAPILSAVGW
ncbi:hypothetical protein [Streptomyces kronopolitis]|uniref:hypothetical protein n=1 Tax=Streptomyces kronopolitis TaxID=1612435 RepID=UPI00367DE7E3